jgi:hypothetical protein
MNKCDTTCTYYAECLEARVNTEDPREGVFLSGMLAAGEDCLNTPPPSYTAEGYRDCAVLASGRLSVELSVHSGERLTLAEIFYADFTGVDTENR